MSGGAYAAATEWVPSRATIHVATSAPNGVPVDREPRAAVARAAGLLAALGHVVQERTPAWDDERFSRAWNLAGMAGIRYMIRRLGRMEGRAPDLTKLEPANCDWIADGPPVDGPGPVRDHGRPARLRPPHPQRLGRDDGPALRSWPRPAATTSSCPSPPSWKEPSDEAMRVAEAPRARDGSLLPVPSLSEHGADAREVARVARTVRGDE